LGGALTGQVPQVPLPIQFQNYADDQYSLEVDWAYVRQYCGAEPEVVVGVEETPSAAPTVSNPSPSDGATDVPVTLPELSFLLSDAQGDSIDYTVTITPNVIDKMKQAVLSNLNDKIDIPLLDEQQEGEFFEICWDCVEDAIRDVLDVK